MIFSYFCRVALYYFFRLFPIQKNKIFFQNFNGKGYGDNPKYIIEEIIRRGLNFDLVWAVKPEAKKIFPQTVRTVNYKSICAIYEEVTAKIWIDNCRKQPYVRKRKNQFYIQTWHGGPNILKKLEKDVEANLSKYYVKQAKQDSTIIDLFLSCEKNRKDFYKSTLWYNGEILESGSPADDLFFNQTIDIKEKIYTSFSIAKSTKIVLYAPTFRNTFNVDVIDLDYQLILNYLCEKTKENWIFLVRLHPNVSEKAAFITYSSSIINATNYDDVQELMFASDILISDYSGMILEFAMMKKPIFLYAKDYTAYVNERDFYIDLFSLPFPVAMTNNELIEKIIQFDNILYQKEVDVFFKRIGLLDDGNASAKVVDRIIAEIQDT